MYNVLLIRDYTNITLLHDSLHEVTTINACFIIIVDLKPNSLQCTCTTVKDGQYFDYRDNRD